MDTILKRTHETPEFEFRKWFRGSRVIDGFGDPLVVYHGTDTDFEVFEVTEDVGFHFGPAAAANARIEQAQLESARILPVVLSIKSPLRLPDLHTWAPRSVLNALVEAAVITDEQADSIELVDRETVAELLADKGYDGIVYENVTEGGGDCWIAMRADQIKSAIGIRCTFAISQTTSTTDSATDRASCEVLPRPKVLPTNISIVDHFGDEPPQP